MTTVRSDACFKLDITSVRHALEKGWVSGTITWTLGVNDRHPHYYHRIGTDERGVVMMRYDTIFHGNREMQMAYERVPAGFGGTRLVWCCPKVGCEHPVKTLYRPHGGAYFLCRHCWNVRYASQYESRRFRAWRRFFDLQDHLCDQSLSDQKWDKAARALDAVLPALGVELDDSSQRLQDDIGHLSDSTRGPGRPSKRKERARLRAARAAERAELPKQPPGRPKEKRAYVRRSALVLSERMNEMQAYCPRCRDRRDMLRPKPVAFKNGRPAVQGKCAVCQTTMARIVTAEERIRHLPARS